MRNCKCVIILSLGDLLLSLLLQLLVLLLDLFHCLVVLLLDQVQAICEHDNISLTRVHLIKCIHHHCECIILEDKQKHYSLFILIALNQSNRAMLHLTSSHCLGMNIVQLFYLQSSFLCNCH